MVSEKHIGSDFDELLEKDGFEPFWVYDRGTWIEKGIFLLKWKDTQDNFLIDNNFSINSKMVWGNEDHDTNIYFYKHCEKDVWYCDCDPGEYSVFPFVIPNLPSLLMFRKEYYSCFLPYDSVCRQLRSFHDNLVDATKELGRNLRL